MLCYAVRCVYKLASFSRICPSTPSHFSHSPSAIFPLKGSLPPSKFPNPSSLCTASLMPKMPFFTTNSSAVDTNHCSFRTSSRVLGSGAAEGPLEVRSLWRRSEEHTSELQSQSNLVCRLLLEKKNG